MLFEIFLGEVLEVSLGEVDGGVDGDLLLFVGDFDVIAEFSELAIDLDPLPEELGEVSGVENLVFDGAGAVDAECEMDWFFLLSLHCGGN